MERYRGVIQNIGLFKGIAPETLASMLDCLQAQTVTYKKGSFVLSAGEKPEYVGALLSGQLQITRDDADGNRTLLTTLAPSDIFAEVFCCAGVDESPVNVMADADSTVMLLQFSRVLHTCPNSCQFHQTLIENMMRQIAQKSLYLQDRIEIIRIKSVRVKVLSYLNTFPVERGRSFTIPFNREEMADYLCVERSALSHELMRMKQDGLIDYYRNKFTLF